MLDEDQSFSMTANVTAPGYQRVALKGYITQRRSDGTYAAPLLPQLFYGADGNVLTSWRQYLPAAGSHVILSRSGGLPTLPREELFWRKISDMEEKPKEEAVVVEAHEVDWKTLLLGALVGAGIIGLVLYFKRK